MRPFWRGKAMSDRNSDRVRVRVHTFEDQQSTSMDIFFMARDEVHSIPAFAEQAFASCKGAGSQAFRWQRRGWGSRQGRALECRHATEPHTVH